MAGEYPFFFLLIYTMAVKGIMLYAELAHRSASAGSKYSFFFTFVYISSSCCREFTKKKKSSCCRGLRQMEMMKNDAINTVT